MHFSYDYNDINSKGHLYGHQVFDVVGLGLFLFLFGIAFYFLPSLISIVRRSQNMGLVWLTNFFVGWTFFGWFIALYMALTFPAREGVKPPPLRGPNGGGF